MSSKRHPNASFVRLRRVPLFLRIFVFATWAPMLLADNPILLPQPNLTHDGAPIDGSVTVDIGDGSVALNSTATGTWEYRLDGVGSWSTLSSTINFPSAIDEGEILTYELRFTDPGSNWWTGTVVVRTGTSDGACRHDDLLTDNGANVSSSGSCEAGQCATCHECEEKHKSGSATVDDGAEADPDSLMEKIDLPAAPNEPDFEEGGLILYRTRLTSAQNAGDRGMLRYAGVPTMKVLVEDDSPVDAGLIYTCSIRQASGFAIEFQIRSGENFGRPTGPYIHSGARIELLDDGSVVTNPAAATHVRQYRQNGGIMVFDKTTGLPAEYSTRTGRVYSDPAAMVELYESGGDLTQVKSAAGLLVLAEVGARKYTVKRYLPWQVSGSSAPYTASGDPVMTVTIEHPSATATVEVKREIDGRQTRNDWAYSVAGSSNTWTLTRKDWSGSAWTTAWSKARSNSTDGGGAASITRTWKTAGGTAFYTGNIYNTSTKSWGAKAGTSSTATDGGRSVSYYDNSASLGSFGKLSAKTDRAGLNEAYEYDSNGRMTLRKSEWLDTVNSKHEVFGYTTHVSGEVLKRNDYRPRTTTVKVEAGANTISKTMFAAYVDGTSGEYTEITKQAASPSASWSDAANLVSIRTYYSASESAVRMGRLKQVTEPGGDVTTYDYAAGGTASSALTVTVKRELDSAGAAIAGRSSRSVTVHDALGRVRSVTRGVYVDGTSGWVDYELATDDYTDDYGDLSNGAFGYRYRQQTTDLVGSNVRTIGPHYWAGGRLVSVVDEPGMATIHAYDSYGRLFQTTRNGAEASGGFPGQDVIVTTTSGTTPVRSGRRIGFKDEQTVTVGDALEMISSVARDDWGRVTSSTDTDGYVTSYSYADSGRTVTMTRPDGRTEITDRHKDGRIDSVTGTGVVAGYISYSVNGSTGQITTTHYAATDGNARYVASVTNMLGQTVSTTRPSRNGGSASTTTVTNYYEVGTGDLERRSSSAGNVPHQLAWEDASETTRREITSTDTTISLDTDRVSESVASVELASGKLWRVQRAYVYVSGSTPFHLSTSRTLLGGFAANEIARNESTNELSDQTTVSTTTLASGLLTQTTNHPETTADSVSVSYHGRLMASSQPGVGTTTFGYDDLGRRTTTTDPRTGTSTVAYADHLSASGYTTSLVETSTDAATNVTAFEYRAQGTLGAGQVKKVTRPDTTTTWTSYTSLGLVQARWGAGIYATYHVYDAYGQMTGLRTYKALGHGTEPTSVTTGFAETEWNYDAATGHLLSKRYLGDDGPDIGDKGPTYTYDTAGRTKTRAWARLGADNTTPILTTYSYTAFGELDKVVYANETENTPDLDYSYDRLGRVDLVIQGEEILTPEMLHRYDYDGTTLALESEVIEYDIDRDGNNDIARELVRHRDAYLRNTGYELSADGLAAGYNYDGAGRLDRVWKDPTFASGLPSGDPDFIYSYRYELDSAFHFGTASAVGIGVVDSGILFHVTGPVHKVVNNYEVNRDVLASKENEEISGTDDWSKYAYTANSLGQRTALDLALDPDVDGASPVSSDVAWDYNQRDELVEADHEITAHERAYAFDGIGNRTETVAGTTILTATPDYTANSLNQYSKVEGTNLPAGAHDDDGNLVDDGTLEYYWDAENRLVRVSDGTNTLVEYIYDYLGRRIAKISTADSPQGEETRVYFYDGWNLIGENVFAEIVDPENSEETIWEWTPDFSYTWGLDLSQSMQGAGGVGGLLAVEKHLGTDADEYYPTFDGNGNVSEYLNSAGAQVAHYQYDPFGNQLSLSSGTLKDMFPHRFSTKYHDPETGFYYYGYRFYDPVTGRWVSREVNQVSVNPYLFRRAPVSPFTWPPSPSAPSPVPSPARNPAPAPVRIPAPRIDPVIRPTPALPWIGFFLTGWTVIANSHELGEKIVEVNEELELAQQAHDEAMRQLEKHFEMRNKTPCTYQRVRRIGYNDPSLYDLRYAAQFGPGEWLVTTPEGDTAQYDSGYPGIIMFEAKFDHSFMIRDDFWIPLYATKLKSQFTKQWNVAARCGFKYEIVVSTSDGAAGINKHVPGFPVRHVPPIFSVR